MLREFLSKEFRPVDFLRSQGIVIESPGPNRLSLKSDRSKVSDTARRIAIRWKSDILTEIRGCRPHNREENMVINGDVATCRECGRFIGRVRADQNVSPANQPKHRGTI